MSDVLEPNEVNSEPSAGDKNFAYDSLESVRKKLLDLSGRNALLNYRHPRASCVRLIDELPDQIVDELRSDKSFTFIPVSEPTEEELIDAGYIEISSDGSTQTLKDYPTAEQWAKHLGFATSYELPEKGVSALGIEYHQDNDLQTLMYAPELDAKLRSLRSKAETAIEESGANILYLAVGFLEWFETNKSDVKRTAPLFTVPVKLERSKRADKSGVFRYTITLKEDGLLTNITLREKLANDFGLSLPGIEDETTPEAYFDKIKLTILKQQVQWKVRRQVSLVLLNFTKQAMYQDLDPENWPKESSIQEHPLIAKFFSKTGEEGGYGGASYENEHPIDNIPEIHDKFPLVFDADSSQHSALIDAINGEDLVIEGPPGTGKSQTIANLIAASVANGKKVLFVAEKMAALNVVKDRLDRVGLGDFCLELHSHKTNKQKILKDLGERLNKQNKFRLPENINAEIQRFEDLKGKLLEYVELINSQWLETGLTLHEILNKATRYREKLGIDPDKFKITGIDGTNLTVIKQKEIIDQADMLRNIFDLVSEQATDGEISNHYWYGVTNTELKGYQADDLSENLKDWTSALERLSQYWDNLNQELEFGLQNDTSLEKVESLSANITLLPNLIGNEPLEYLEYLVAHVNDFEKWIHLYNDIHKTHTNLSKVVKIHAIDDVETRKTISGALNFFSDLGINTTTSLEELTNRSKDIVKTSKTLTEIHSQFSKIIQKTPDALRVCFVATTQGLEEFSTLVNLIGELPPELWRYRDDVYDNSDIDPLLESMTKQLKNLTPLHKQLHEHFSLHRLPEVEALKQHQLILDSGGFFKWLSSDWRHSRKSILSLSALPKPNAKNILNMLPSLIQYSEGIEEMDKLNESDDALGNIYKGVDTPIKRATKLRQWYKKVRAEYGVGFGDRVLLGSTLLSMDKSLAVAISDDANHGLGEMVSSAIKSVSNFIDIFPSYTSLKNIGGMLESPLVELSMGINKQLDSLSACINGSSHDMNSLENIVVELERQSVSIEVWGNMDITNELAKSSLSLTVNAGSFSQELYDRGINTLKIAEILVSAPELLRSIGSKPDIERYASIIESLSSLLEHISACEKSANIFVENGLVNLNEWLEPSKGLIKSTIARNQKALDNPNWLETWLDYVKLRNKLRGHGLENIISQLETESISTKDLHDVVALVIHHQLADEILEKHATLASFTGMEQMAHRKKFQEYDRKLMSLQSELVAYKASRGKAPSGISSGKVGGYSEIGLIAHNMTLKKPRIAVRSLIDRAGKSMQTLKPCFMMSPMSVAQYLKPGKFKFDLVVMDEASQIRPEDSLGAVARGESLVVVGDPKQLPPTSFFQKITSNDEDNDEAVALEESESILESVMPMFKTRRLRWHYRSRHESLIAFSNHRFYDSNLVLFPSPFKESDEFGIRFNRVHKGRFVSRRNVEEAIEVANVVAKQLIEHPDESVGVVAMSAEQSDEIERQLEQLVKDNPRLQQAYEHNRTLDETLFVKNLENVQGDERDVIIISMTYGPETVGASSMHQRFGPINNNVGWRRLNVLFTRSKKRMHICSSMDSGHVRTSENSSRGVVALKAFLEYCETGHLQHYTHTGKAADSDFEIAVMDALASHGYECEPQLGVTGYFLDIAVKDPGMPGRFLMGVECDGASYHSAKSTRDRDRLRQDILENLGWKIRRIWSTDWFKNPQAQLQPILQELERLRTPVPESVPEELTITETIIEEESVIEAGEPEFETEPEPEIDLRKRLIDFDEKIIRKNNTNISGKERLLRPAMLEALLNFLPCSKAEFLETIPAYLRNGTSAKDGEYLDSVLELIADYG